MGYNSFVLIQNRDLELIEKDPEFGKNVISAIRGADMVRHFSKQTEPLGQGRTSFLSEVQDLHKQPRTPYDIQTAVSQHSTYTQLFMIEDNLLVSLPFRGGDMPIAKWERVTYNAKSLGINSKLGKGFDTRKMEQPQVVNDPWSDEAFRDGCTGITLLNDEHHEIERRENVGASFATAIRRAWKIARDNAINPNEQREYGRFADGEITSLTPPGVATFVAVDRNWGRTISREAQRPDQAVDDVNSLRRELARVGFSTQLEGEQRMKAPPSWSKDSYVKIDTKPDDDGPSI